MAKYKRVPISTARGELFKLAELVRQSRDGTVVVLEGRGGVESVALVREARLAYLEDRVARMDLQAPAPFTLAGSLASSVDDETVAATLRELRQAWDRPAPDDPRPLKAPASKQPAVRRRPRRA